MRYNPQFEKLSVTGQGLVTLKLSGVEVDSIIEKLRANAELLGLMREYIALARGKNAEPPEGVEIEMREKIFPYFDNIFNGRGKEYKVFSADIAEEMFQRLERELGVNGDQNDGR